jgi:hypothetical protein
VVNGVCEGGNVTMHGQMDGMVVEGNLIEQDAGVATCYGFSFNPGYQEPEYFRNFVVRNNTVKNVGNCSVCLNAAPGIVVENNLFIKTHAGYHAGVSIGGGTDADDDRDTGATVRNNTACFPVPATPQQPQTMTAINSTGNTVTGNVTYTGAQASTGVCAR